MSRALLLISVITTVSAIRRHTSYSEYYKYRLVGVLVRIFRARLVVRNNPHLRMVLRFDE